MMTQTHILIAASLFARPDNSLRQNSVILGGSIAPDIAIFVLFIWSKFVGIPEQELWLNDYFAEPMLTYTAISNSLPLYLTFLIFGILLNRPHYFQSQTLRFKNIVVISFRAAKASLLGLFSLAAIIHLLGDFPVHVSDAHPHFWPFSDWRFESVLSYWDNKHYGSTFSLFEAGLGIALALVLFRRFKSPRVKAAAALAILAYAVVPLYFYLS